MMVSDSKVRYLVKREVVVASVRKVGLIGTCEAAERIGNHPLTFFEL